jgi:phospholipid/cholesterol/gamma-HCH transport system substrate-binding protein
MERDARYTAVGAFVILIAVMAGLFVYWYSGKSDRRDYTRYEIYFEGSVSGLTVGGQVRYLGVDVGRVVRIRIDPRGVARVQVVADIDSSAPVTDQTLAQLSLQGITGLLFVDLQQRKPASQVLPAVPSQNYPVIGSVRSDFDVFLATLPDVASRTRELLIRLDTVLSPDNAQAISRTLHNLGEASKPLPQAAQDLQAMVADLKVTAADTRTLVHSLSDTSVQLGPELAKAVENLRKTSENAVSLSKNLDAAVAENRSDVRAFVRDGLPQLQQTLREARAALQDVRTLSRGLGEDPSRLIYQPNYRGVEIPR